MAEHQELYLAWNEAIDRRSLIQDELDRSIATLRQQFSERLQDAHAAVAKAQTAIDEMKVSAGLRANADMPTYTLYEWMNESRSGWDRAAPYKRTGRKGRYEVRTPESQFATPPWAITLGEMFIRILKKDGSPSKRFETVNQWGEKWLPEGQDPNQEKETAANPSPSASPPLSARDHITNALIAAGKATPR
jgi:hypothetical protein